MTGKTNVEHMEPSVARDTTSSTNTSHISHSAGQRMCFDVCIQKASAKIHVSQSHDLSCTELSGPAPLS